MINNELKYFLFFLILVISLKYLTFNLSYHWDESLYVYYGKWFSIHGLFSIPPHHYGHVPMFSWILAGFYVIFGESVFITHFIVALFSFFSIYFTYLIGKFLFNKNVGIIASLFTFFSPIFFAISGQALIDVSLVAFTMMTLYFGLKKQKILYLIFASFLVLTKEPGFLAIIALAFYQLIKKEKIQNILFFLLPLIVLFSWLNWYKLQIGIYGRGWENGLNEFVSFTFLAEKCISILYQIFIWNYNWILTIFLILYFKFEKKITPLIIMSFFYIALFSYGPLLPRYILPIYPIFFIISSKTLEHFGNKKFFISALIIILFISCYRWNWGLKGFFQDPVFHSTIFYPKTITSVKNGEISLDYIDIVKLEKSAFDFIFTYYKNSTITAINPFILPENIGILDVGYGQWIKNNITVLYPINEENINKSNLVVVESYSNFYDDNKDKFSNIFSKLELLKKFENNGKFLIIYKGGK
jgi:4-amino-4-deoxy-L-arabinose transferase-like glycosyltransferase